MPRPGFSIGDLIHPKKRKYRPDIYGDTYQDDAVRVAGRRAATKIREDLNLTALPVELERVCEYLAVTVTDVDEIIGNPNAIGVNRGGGLIEIVGSLSRPIYRFTLAHELGHEALQHTLRNAWDTTDNLLQPADPFEYQAWDFAGELLMPYRTLKEYRKCSLEKLSTIFGVTKSAVSVQLSKRNLL